LLKKRNVQISPIIETREALPIRFKLPSWYRFLSDVGRVANDEIKTPFDWRFKKVGSRHPRFGKALRYRWPDLLRLEQANDAIPCLLDQRRILFDSEQAAGERTGRYVRRLAGKQSLGSRQQERPIACARLKERQLEESFIGRVSGKIEDEIHDMGPSENLTVNRYGGSIIDLSEDAERITVFHSIPSVSKTSTRII
jgi:hypothetical protein